MLLDDKKTDDILASVPGAKRAAHGVILPLEGGGFFHVRSIRDRKELEGLTVEEELFHEFCSKKEIIRLRELRGAHDYLLRLRANAIVNSQRAIRVMIARRKKFEKKGRSWALSVYYHSKDHYHKSYIRHLVPSKRKRLLNIPSGLAFIPEANAVCIRSLAGDVVVASESLENFCYFMTIGFYGDQLGIDVIDRIDAIIIALRIMNGAEALDFDIDPRAMLPPETDRMIFSLVKNQMQFVFGHEFGHFLLEHLSLPDTISSKSSTDKADAYRTDLCIYSHELEFQADLCALNFISHNEQVFSEITLGAFSVLLYVNFLEHMLEQVGLKRFSISETHPRPRERIYRLQKGLGKKSSIDDKTLSGMLSVSDSLVRAVKYRVEQERKDLLTFYGSIYLSGYTSKIKVDRYHF